MSPQTAAILGLMAMFVMATAWPVNMGAVGFAMAFLVGTLAVGMPAPAIIAGFPADLFVTLVGITYLFAIAQRNGTIGWLVQRAVRAVGGRIAAIPWIMFATAAALTAMGAVSPAACAILAPIALQFARGYGISPLLMGLLVIHGAQGGGFSPISVYGGITNQIVARSGLPAQEMVLFLACLGFNLLVALGAFLAFGGRDLIGRRHAVPAATAEGSAAGLDLQQAATLGGLAALAVGGLAFGLDIGLLAVTIAVALTLLAPAAQKGAAEAIGWSTILLVGGVITYVGVLQASGAIDGIGRGVSGLGAPLLAALLLCYIGGVVSAFASSLGVLGAVIPLAVPVLQQGQVGTAGMIAALAIASTVVDVSPFSTNGALVVANAAPEERETVYRRLLAYSILVVLAGPPLAWLILIVPGWL
ncbi:SLC13 family permease [Dankookia sp. GCM10030260]|uniref:SLC13 family permease n=1 Tax=Dankookia sp. GCM10030260 TaxID=3273390 RepID=UPI0036219767